MCIIAKGAKKDMRRDEVVQCMKNNRYGFFIAVLKQDPSKNVFVRTLEEDDILKAFDAAGPDDTIVTHSRIPSRGGNKKNIEDVHGWEAEGVRFCHNMTLSCLDDVQKEEKWNHRTDSEYFFKQIFIPMWLAAERQWTPWIERIVKVVCGGWNKFLFILPDNSIRMYGRWEKDHGCFFSNTGYLVPKYERQAAYSFSGQHAAQAALFAKGTEAARPVQPSLPVSSMGRESGEALAEALPVRSLLALSVRAFYAIAANLNVASPALNSSPTKDEAKLRNEALLAMSRKALPSTLISYSFRNEFTSAVAELASDSDKDYAEAVKKLYRTFQRALAPLTFASGLTSRAHYVEETTRLAHEVTFALSRYNVLMDGKASSVEDYGKMFRLKALPNGEAIALREKFGKLLTAFLGHDSAKLRNQFLLGLKVAYLGAGPGGKVRLDFVKGTDAFAYKAAEESPPAVLPASVPADGLLEDEEAEYAELNAAAAVIGGFRT